MTNLQYDSVSNKLTCDHDPEVDLYDFCVKAPGAMEYDSVTSTLPERDLSGMSLGACKGKGRGQTGGKWGVYCPPIDFVI